MIQSLKGVFVGSQRQELSSIISSNAAHANFHQLVRADFIQKLYRSILLSSQEH